MRPLRVLHVISTLKAYGAERQVLELLPSLAADGIEVGALAVYNSNLSADDERALGGIAQSVGRSSRRDYSFIPALVRKISAFRPDIVHTHTHVGKYWGRPAARIAGVHAIVHTEHNPCDPRRNVAERFLDRAYGRFTDRFVFFFPEQGELLARLESIAPRKLVAIPNGLNADAQGAYGPRDDMRRLLAIPDDRLAVMMIGRLEYQKNHELALRAFARLDPELRARTSLYVVGAGSAQQRLQLLAENLGIAGETHFTGYRNDANRLLSAADILLNTSLFEGMPMTFIEAMLANAAIVTTPWVGAMTMLADGELGFIAPGWDATDVAAILERALRDSTTRTACSAAAAVRARNDYTVSRTAAAHRRLYESIVVQDQAS